MLSATEIARYFLLTNGKKDNNGTIRPRSIGDFIRDCQVNTNPLDVYHVCSKLERYGILVSASSEPNGSPPMNKTFYCFRLDEGLAEYGVYEFLCYGFQYIRNYFSNSVLPIIVEKKDGTEDIGTGFLVTDIGVATAAHCIKNMKKITIPGWEFSKENIEAIHVPEDENIDLAFLQFKTNPFEGTPGFKFREGNILEEVLTMGYPPIPGFQSVLVAEKAHISGYLSASSGQLIGSEYSYLDKQNYFLITARIKGGNSGGPIIGNDGYVLGVVAQIPANAEGRADLIGYGVTIPSNTFISFIQSIVKDGKMTKLLNFEINEYSLSTIN